MRGVQVSMATLALVSVAMLQNGCTTASPEDAEDEEVHVALPLIGTCTQELNSAEAESILGLTGPVTANEFAIGVDGRALNAVLVDAQGRTLTVGLSQSNYTANLIRYDVSMTSTGNVLALFSCDAGDVRFKAFEIVCMHWVNRSFPTNDLKRIARAELSGRAVTANDIISYFQRDSTNQSDGITPGEAAKVLGVSLPVDVNTLTFCSCDAPMFCVLIDSAGLRHPYEFEHANGRLKFHDASVREPEQREALRVLLCDWCEREFPRANRSTRLVTRPKSEEIANRVLAYFCPEYVDPTFSIELLNGKPFTGKVCTYFANGRKKSERPYVNGRENGIETHWHENGQRKEQGTLVEGLRNGKWILWYENGNRAEEGEWLESFGRGEVAWYPNGTKKREMFCSDEGAITNRITYYPNGMKRQEIQTPLSGNDVSRMWDVNGKPIAFTNETEEADDPNMAQ